MFPGPHCGSRRVCWSVKYKLKAHSNARTFPQYAYIKHVHNDKALDLGPRTLPGFASGLHWAPQTS